MPTKLFSLNPLLLLAVSVLLAFLFSSPRQLKHHQLKHQMLSSSSLFQDCKDLRELTLPPRIKRLDWIKGKRLEKLNASATKISSLEGLPSSLRELDVSNNASLESLQSVPRGLRSLDIRGTKIRNLQDLPPRLEVLKVSGSAIRGLKSLGPHLRELYLENVEVNDFVDLPRDLKGLHLTGRNFESLIGLPPALRVLTLQGTRIGSLKGLPSALQDLELTQSLTDNPIRFEIEDLPERLTKLAIEAGLGPFDLSDRKYLVWLADLRDAPTKRTLPPFLSSVTLKAPSAQLPSSVRALALEGATSNPLDNLPPGLEDLSLEYYTGPELGRLPSNLKRFSVKYTSLAKLPIMPAELAELQIIQTDIVSFDGIPGDLQILVFCQTQVKKIDGIRDRFAKLQQLDLCESAFLEEIGPLPKGLKKLNISQTSVHWLPAGLKDLGDLEDLNISRTPIRLSSLKELPRKLKVLTVSDGQVSSWEGFPPGLQTLRFEGTAGEEAGRRP